MKEHSFDHLSKCKSPIDFFTSECMHMLIYEKNSTMMTVLLLQHRHISSSNKRAESYGGREREKEGDKIFIFICVVHKRNLR
jgi:hypothetical protein